MANNNQSLRSSGVTQNLTLLTLISSIALAACQARMSERGSRQKETVHVDLAQVPDNSQPNPADVKKAQDSRKIEAPTTAKSTPQVRAEEPGAPEIEKFEARTPVPKRIASDSGLIRDEIALQFQPRTKKLDVLFVLDTSASMRDEHQKISDEITSFISELSLDVSYRFGVLLGHGPHTRVKSVKVGHLYSETGKDQVIKADEFLEEIRSDREVVEGLHRAHPDWSEQDFERELRSQAAHRVADRLRARLTNLPDEGGRGAQGEAGLLNLYKALGENRQELKNQGFLRDESALLVIFLADENDVCYDYGAAERRGEKVIRHYAKEIDLKTEEAAFLDAETCAHVANGQRLTPEIVAQTVRAAKTGWPTIVSGIMYIDEDSLVKAKASDQFSKDNEPGRGYLDLIKLMNEGASENASNGLVIDLADQDFKQKLSKIGDYSNFHMKYVDTFEFKLSQPESLKSEDLVLYIQSGNGEDHEVAKSAYTAGFDDKQKKFLVRFDYKELEVAYKAGFIDSGAKLILEYREQF